MRLLRPIVITVAFMILFGTLSVSAQIDQLRISFDDGHTVMIDLRDVGGVFTKMFPTPLGVTFEVPSDKMGEDPIIYKFDLDDLHSMTSVEIGSSVQSEIAAAAVATDNIVFTPIGANILRITGSDIRSAADIRVYDMAGRRVVAEVSGDGSGYILSIDPLRPGIYLINVGNTTVKVSKL